MRIRAAIETERSQSSADTHSSSVLFQRITRNVGWLIVSDGFRLASMAANLLIARFVGASNFGIVTLARETARYAALPGDLGISTYGQAEAARCAPGRLAELADEIVPTRAAIGLIIYLLLALVCIRNSSGRITELVFVTSGLFVVSESLRVDWLFRGRERFELVAVARAVETIGFLLMVVLIGSRPHAVVLDSAAWSLSELVMAIVWLVLLPGTIGRSVRLRINVRNWFSHATEAMYVPIAIALVWGGWLMLLWIVAGTGSHRDVGILAAPYGITMSLINMGIMLVMGFFPVSASLSSDSVRLTEIRRTLTIATLILGLPIATIGTVIAKPLNHFLLGPAYDDSAVLLQLLIWLAPLRLIRAAYGYTLISSGFQKLFPLGPAAALVVGVIVGVPLTLRDHARGAAVAALIAEVAGTATTVSLSSFCYGDWSAPKPGWLLKFAMLNLALATSGLFLVEHLGWMLYLITSGIVYAVGLTALELLDVRGTALVLWRSRNQIVPAS